MTDRIHQISLPPPEGPPEPAEYVTTETRVRLSKVSTVLAAILTSAAIFSIEGLPDRAHEAIHSLAYQIEAQSMREHVHPKEGDERERIFAWLEQMRRTRG